MNFSDCFSDEIFKNFVVSNSHDMYITYVFVISNRHHTRFSGKNKKLIIAKISPKQIDIE